MRGNGLCAVHLWLAAVSGVVAVSARAQDPAAYFKQNCVSCHTIGGGRLVGPDLKDVTTRQSKEWLAKFIRDPQAVIASGDAYAKKILGEAGGVVMPAIPGMTDAVARSLVDLIESESALAQSQFKGVQVSDRPFLPADVEQGHALFTGHVPLKNRGPACLSCHALPEAGALGGGTLGPDLTKAYERLGGRKGLSGWLSAPATPTMQAVFKSAPIDSEEILPLVACLQEAARNNAAVAAGHGRLAFVITGTALAVAGLVLMNRIWRGRLRGIRSLLVENTRTQGDA
ncbi:MAG TPA: cytochrome c [Phycisphaerae bacterium]|nr:cytochrome c [Phycisphaerae bacterium]HOJ75095.1 cytochrome c [Phycisphaerae bacterium]HOM53480.1 cytochrome c [Phycisphaerae bacterium]HON66850.1 cytochrome c [Phycisphaerae bacterium]HOQ86510.1 cytochrome c [Phycisphaerae bacterium]